jgi:hypothetical protein
MFAYPCPSCAQRLLATPDRAGEQSACPKCLHPLTVPSPDSVAPDLSAVVLAAPLTETPLPAALQEVTLELAAVAVAEVGEESEFEPPMSAPPPDFRTARAAAGPTSRRPLADDGGRVILNPTGLFAVDIAAELSAAISMRMAPPPEPGADRLVTLAAWLAGTAAAGLLWLTGVVTAPELFPFVALIGGAMVAFGYLWRAYLAGRQRPLNGLVTLLPPVALARLFAATPAHGLRPLRFALTGAVLLGLFVLGPAVRAAFEGEFGVRVEPATPEPFSPVANFRKAVAGKKHAEAVAELKRFPGKDAVPDDQKRGVIADLLALTTADRADVRAAALTVLAEFSPADGKAAVRAGLKSTDGDERAAACRVADRVFGADAAGDLAERLTDREDRPEAKAALIRLGAAAEAAVLPLLKSDREPVALVACEVLERIGGAKAEAELRALAETTKSRAVRQEATQAAETVAERVTRGG